MKNILVYYFISLGLISGCRPRQEPKENATHLPSKHYHFVERLPAIVFEETVYVPVYSDIYMINGERKLSLTATLSIRNTSEKDSMYLKKVDYYGSDGKFIRSYINKPVLLTSLQSLEFIVDYNESEGGAGANFMVYWGATTNKLKPVIQTVMIGSNNQQGFSFVTNGVVTGSRSNTE